MVAVIGGGTAGAHAAAALRSFPVAVTIIEPTGHHQFLTRLAAVAGGTQPGEDATASLAELFPSAAIVQHRAVELQESADSVTIRLDDDRTLAVDAAIVTAGAEPSLPSVPGLARARTLRSASDALGIRTALNHIERLVVVGGGATGSQLAGAARVAHPELDVTLVEASDALLSGFRPALGRRTAEILGERGVDIECNTTVKRVRKLGVTLAGEGRHIDGLVVWAGGYAAAGDQFGIGDTRDGRIVIDATGRVVRSARVFAAGDIAAHTDRTGALRPMSAQVAAQAGRSVGANTARSLLGSAMAPMQVRDLGWVVDLGGGRGVAEILGLPLADPITDRLVPLIHTAIDYRNLWQIGGLEAMRHHGPGHSTTPSIEQLDDDLGALGLDL
jgi:NADH dehydrogenase